MLQGVIPQPVIMDRHGIILHTTGMMTVRHQTGGNTGGFRAHFSAVITGDGPLELRTPRDRDGTFEPQLVKKNQTRITGMDNQILSLYAKGMTTREIAAAFKELYDADVSPALTAEAGRLTGRILPRSSLIQRTSAK